MVMKRLHDTFLETINNMLDLSDKEVLEIGCGNGSKTVSMANMCKQVVAIDPDAIAIKQAKNDFVVPNLKYLVGTAESLPFKNASFDIAIFSLSLHHVRIDSMQRALTEAARVTSPSGKIIVLEPAFNGTFFDAELLFGISDGDERKEKAAAYYHLLSCGFLQEDTEFYDEIYFKFSSVQDFIGTMNPTQNLADIPAFLDKNSFMLNAQRRINILSLT